MDHDRINITHSNISCGVNELSRISEETEQAIFAVANYCNHPSRGNPPAFFIASDVSNVETSTSRFMKIVESLNLGTVSVSEPEINPKTGNPIQIYIWKPDHKNLRDYYINTKIQKLKVKL